MRAHCLHLGWLLVLGCSSPTGEVDLADASVPDARTRDGGASNDGTVDVGADAAAEADAWFDPPRGFTAMPMVFPEPQWAERYPVPCYLDNVVACAALRFAGGVAVGDVDGDGLPDVLFTHFDAPNALYLNRGDFVFERQHVPAFEDARLSNGAAFADIDNDGDLDLVVGVMGDAQTQLFVQHAPLHFVEEGEARGVALPTGDLHASMSQCFGDYDLDGFLDLTTSAWRPVSDTDQRTGNGLFRNLGAMAPGSFSDVTDALGLRAENTRALGVPGAWGFTPALVDLDGDGRPEFVQTADFETSRLFWNEAAPEDGMAFLDGTSEAGVGTEENGMGAAFGDYDNDGDLDYFVTAIFDDDCRRGEDCYWGRSGNRLFRNEGGRRFVDVTDAAGVRDAGWGWGARFFDFDLDGDLDLVATNGIRHTTPDTGYETDPIKLWRNEGDGTFVDVAAELGLVDDGVGRAVVPVDLDGDGDLDLVVTHTLDPPLVWRNDAAEIRSWLVVDPRGTSSNRDGYGAEVRVWPTADATPMVRLAGNGCGFLGNDPGRPHFGLGTHETVARVEVRWPRSGQIQNFFDVPARTVLRVNEPVDE